MISYLNKVKSLGNLCRAEIGGQIATILLFMMVAVLVFVMFTVNIGDLGVKTTALSNAADSASLYLASQLSTRSRVLWQALDGSDKYCKKRGLLAFIGSLLLGPLGGAIGGLIDGSGFWQGLTTGFRVALGMLGAMLLGGGPLSPLAWILVAIDVGAEIYNYCKADRDVVNAMDDIVKNLDGLELGVQLRESVYIRMLGQLVDDPNKWIDAWDIDRDGNREELADQLDYRLYIRTSTLKKNGNLNNDVSDFILGGETVKESLTAFKEFAEKQVSRPNLGNGYLSRCEFTSYPGYPCPAFNTYDGPIIYLARGLNKYGIPVSFWKPGSPEKYCAPGKPWYDCPDGKPHDSIDRVTAAFTSLITIADEKIKAVKTKLQEMVEQWVEWIGVFYYVAGDLDDIRPDSEPPDAEDAPYGGYYFELASLVDCDKTCVYDAKGKEDCCEEDFKPMVEWIEEIKRKRRELQQVCHTWRVTNPKTGARKCDNPASVGDTVCNAPCYIMDHAVGTVDDLLDDPDEFDRAIDATQAIIDEIGTFKTQIWNTYVILKSKTLLLYSDDIVDGGVNPMVYSWHDARCPGNEDCHSVQIEIFDLSGNRAIALPYLEKTKNWREVCLKLRNGIGTVTVEVIRKDPSNVKVGILGKWNPFSGVVKRKSKSYYTYPQGSNSGQPYIFGTK